MSSWNMWRYNGGASKSLGRGEVPNRSALPWLRVGLFLRFMSLPLSFMRALLALQCLA
jgi:hypothetical protein